MNIYFEEMTLKYDSDFSHCRNRFFFIHRRNKLFINNTQQNGKNETKIALISVKKEGK